MAFVGVRAQHWRPVAGVLAVLLVGAALSATPVGADPGSPGLGNAAQAVYPDPGVGGEQNEGDQNPRVDGTLPDENLAANAGGDGGGLPFTGFPAALILGIGASALLVGAVVRRHTRQ